MSVVEGEPLHPDFHPDHDPKPEPEEVSEEEVEEPEQDEDPPEDATHEQPSNHGVTITVEDADAEDAQAEDDSGETAPREDTAIVGESQTGSGEGPEPQEEAEDPQ